jgi:hypothetical protein
MRNGNSVLLKKFLADVLPAECAGTVKSFKR